MAAPIDFVSIITTYCDDLVTNFLPLFKPVGDTLFTDMAVVGIIGYAWPIVRALNKHAAEAAMERFQHFIVNLLVVKLCLFYWDVPLYSGLSVHQFIPTASHWLAAQINLGILDTLLFDIRDLLTALQHPGFMQLLEFYTYAWIYAWSMVLEIVMVAISSLGFVALGIGTLVGPLFLWGLMFPKTNFLFWGWLHFELKYGFYVVIAYAQTYIFANAAHRVISNAFAGDYTLAHGIGAGVALAVITGASIAGLFKTGHFAGDLISGGSSAGSSGGSILSVVSLFR